MFYGELDGYSYKTLRTLHRKGVEKNAPISTTQVWHGNADEWSRTKCMWEIRTLNSKGYIEKVSIPGSVELWEITQLGLLLLDDAAIDQMSEWDNYLQLRQSKDETSTQ